MHLKTVHEYLWDHFALDRSATIPLTRVHAS